MLRRRSSPDGLLPEWLLSFLTHSAPPGLLRRAQPHAGRGERTAPRGLTSGQEGPTVRLHRGSPHAGRGGRITAPQGTTSGQVGPTNRSTRAHLTPGGANDCRSTGAPSGVAAELSRSLGFTGTALQSSFSEGAPDRRVRSFDARSPTVFVVGLDPKGFPQTPSQKRFFASLGTYSAHFVRCRRVKSKSPSPKKPAQEGKIKNI